MGLGTDKYFTVILLVNTLLLCSCSVTDRRNSRTDRGGRRRGRCEMSQEVEVELRTLRESQEELRGELTTLQSALQNIHQSVNSLTSLAESGLPEDCSAAHKRGSWMKNVKIKPPGLSPRNVNCEQTIEGGGWTIILSRFSHTPTSTPHPPTSHPYTPTHAYPPTFPQNHRLSFNRSWVEYKNGFGEINGEFWIGNEVLRALTNRIPHQLRIELTDLAGNSVTGTWDSFSVGSENDHYRLSIGLYREGSTAKDDLGYHDQSPFSTYDRENDSYQHEHCAQEHGGGWWYNACYLAHLTGKAHTTAGVQSKQGIVWSSWRGYNTLTAAKMMIRPPPR